MTDPRHRDDAPARRLYGRVQGPKLRNRPLRLLSELYPKLAVPQAAPIDVATLFGHSPKELWLEVGFGKGEHMAAHALAHPDIGYIGCEPYANGMAAGLGHVEDHDLQNVRLFQGDAFDVIARLPDASLDRLFVLHPDPWPKYRHAKRRFINDAVMPTLLRKLKPDALFRIGTDHPIYLRWALMVMARTQGFEWLAETKADWSVRPADWPETRYEQWALSEGRPVWYLQYQRMQTAC
jgi:tRNA (guanine-N7-)-methyltransferase